MKTGGQLSDLLGIVSSPEIFFRQLSERPSWVFPWLFISCSLASVQLGFYLLIDTDFLLDQLVERALQPGVSENDLRAFLQTTAENKSLLAVSSAIGVAIGLLITFAVGAAYLYLVTKLNDGVLGFRSCYAIAAWSSVPAVLSAVVSWIIILTSGGQIGFNAMSPLNMGNFIPGGNGNALPFLELTTLWVIFLTVIGYKVFAGISATRSAVIVLIPYCIIGLIWAVGWS